ncbi:anti-sigma factor [Microbacterium marinum]|uniref:anti-sigma factor n=1 Tax=Microbacterium marinum TaxID=421115 RepID=UPI00384EE123
MNEKDFAELSAGHALHALSTEDERAYRAALEAHPEWADLVAADAQAGALLAEGFGEEEPPSEVRSALLARIAGMPQVAASFAGGPAASKPARDVPVVDEPVAAETPAADAPAADVPPVPEVPAPVAAEAEPVTPTAPPTEVVQTIQRKNWTRGLFALVASAALLVGIGWGVGAIVEQVRTPVEVQALEQIESAPDAQSVVGQFADGGEATVHWSPSVGKVVLTTAETPEIADDRSFELWYVRGDEPIAAGTFEPGEDITALLDGDMEPGDIIAVTVEEQGGSPDGTPTTDPIIAIPTNPGDA